MEAEDDLSPAAAVDVDDENNNLLAAEGYILCV